LLSYFLLQQGIIYSILLLQRQLNRKQIQSHWLSLLFFYAALFYCTFDVNFWLVGMTINP
jgi:hypothetical protein